MDPMGYSIAHLKIFRYVSQFFFRAHRTSRDSQMSTGFPRDPDASITGMELTPYQRPIRSRASTDVFGQKPQVIGIQLMSGMYYTDVDIDKDICMYVCMYVCMHACMHVCIIYRYIFYSPIC